MFLQFTFLCSINRSYYFSFFSQSTNRIPAVQYVALAIQIPTKVSINF